MLSSSDIKRALRDGGFEIYQTKGDVVHLAERVRENLIMDAGVRVSARELTVSFYARAEQSSFPGESPDELLSRAAALGEPAEARGYRRVRSFTTDVPDPSRNDHTLDRWFQVQFDKSLASVDELLDEVRFAIEQDKLATR
ncbi:MAG: hypothetical protein KC731_35210 [Myxococcales bacterium]|nr:hypothetical protein [Myxococcales bacterium]